ncbi:hypothetical protein V6N13_103174 [Hibiscus sabdariffa]
MLVIASYPTNCFPKGMPMTSVFGRVESENKVMGHAREHIVLVLDHITNTTKIMIFWRVSAAMNLKFIAYKLLVEIEVERKEKDGLKIFHHFTES